MPALLCQVGLEAVTYGELPKAPTDGFWVASKECRYRLLMSSLSKSQEDVTSCKHEMMLSRSSGALSLQETSTSWLLWSFFQQELTAKNQNAARQTSPKQLLTTEVRSMIFFDIPDQDGNTFKCGTDLRECGLLCCAPVTSGGGLFTLSWEASGWLAGMF